MFNWKSFLAGSPTSAELGSKADAFVPELEAARERRKSLLEQRDAIYLTGTPSEIERLRREVADAEQEIELLEIKIAGLAKRAAEAKRKEAKAAVERKIAAAEKASADGHRLLTTTYVEQARAMAETLRKLQGIDAIIDAGDAAINEGSRQGLIEARAAIKRPNELAFVREPGQIYGAPPSPVYELVELPDPRHLGPLNDGREHFWPAYEKPIQDQIMQGMAQHFGGKIPWASHLEKAGGAPPARDSADAPRAA